MIYVLLESKYNEVNPFREALVALFPKSAVRRVTAKFDKLNEIKQPPLFSDRWLLVCDNKMSAGLAKRINGCNPDNVLLFTVQSRIAAEELTKRFEELNPFCVDNLNLDPAIALQWVKEQLRCSDDVAQAVVDKANGRTKVLVEGTHNLKSLDTVKKSDVNKYVKKADDGSPSLVFEYLMGWNNRKLPEVVKVVSKYQYGIKWLINFTIKKLEVVKLVFTAMELQGLALDNYVVFRKECADKELERIPEYELKRIMRHHGEVSLQYVYYMILQLKSIGTGLTAPCQLINLLKTI